MAGAFIHHTNIEDAEKDQRKLVCYDCGVACDLSAMRSERLVYLGRLGAKKPREAPPPPAARLVEPPQPMTASESTPTLPKKKGPAPPPRIVQGEARRARFVYAKLGPMISSVHAKDLTWDIEMAVHFREVRQGLGSVDYAVWLAEHARHTPEVPLMIEHLKDEAEYDAAAKHIVEVGGGIGVGF